MPPFAIVRSLLKLFHLSDAEPVPPQSKTAEGSTRSPKQNHDSGPVRDSLPPFLYDLHDCKIPSVKERWYERQSSFKYTETEKSKSREEVAKVVKQYSDDMVQRWKEEMDTLLVYAGLFSAVLTAFNVQSYLLLTPPPPDPVLATLQQISLQLNSFAINPPLVNSTQPATTLTAAPAPPPERWAVVLNVLWFSSLIFSLSAASVAIMVKQWLAEYNTCISGSSPHVAQVRQHRLNSLRKWRVAEIIGILPVLLQIALSLFFAGMLVLLWHLNRTVAIVATILIGALLLLTLITTVLPAFSRDCCYITPPAIGFAFLVFLLARTLVRLSKKALPKEHWEFSAVWKVYKYMDTSTAALTIRGKELKAVSDDEEKLKADMAATAFTTTMDPRNITAAMPIVTMLNLKHTFRYFSQIKAELTRHESELELQACLELPSALSVGLLAMAATVKDYVHDKDTGEWADRLEWSLPRYPVRIITDPSNMCMDLVSVAQVAMAHNSGTQSHSLHSALCSSLRFVIKRNRETLSAQAGKRVAVFATQLRAQIQNELEENDHNTVSFYQGWVATLPPLLYALNHAASDEEVLQVWAHPRYGLEEILRLALSATKHTARVWSGIIHDLREMLETGRNTENLLFYELSRALNIKEVDFVEYFEPREWKTEIERCQVQVKDWISRVKRNLNSPTPQKTVRPVSESDVYKAGLIETSPTHLEHYDTSDNHAPSSGRSSLKILEFMPPRDPPVPHPSSQDGPLDQAAS